MTWRQTLAGAIVVALVAAAVVWYLEDFERARMREMLRDEWSSFLAELPVREQGGGA